MRPVEAGLWLLMLQARHYARQKEEAAGLLAPE
jgi:hypothetical protein